MNIVIRCTQTIVVLLLLSTLALTRSSIPYTVDKVEKITKLQEKGKALCEGSGGLHYVRYNAVFHHRIYCSNNTTIKYTSEL